MSRLRSIVTNGTMNWSFGTVTCRPDEKDMTSLLCTQAWHHIGLLTNAVRRMCRWFSCPWLSRSGDRLQLELRGGGVVRARRRYPSTRIFDGRIDVCNRSTRSIPGIVIFHPPSSTTVSRRSVRTGASLEFGGLNAPLRPSFFLHSVTPWPRSGGPVLL